MRKLTASSAIANINNNNHHGPSPLPSSSHIPPMIGEKAPDKVLR